MFKDGPPLTEGEEKKIDVGIVRYRGNDALGLPNHTIEVNYSFYLHLVQSHRQFNEFKTIIRNIVS